jgi:2-polyprenyl-3-methyl-5-hydroxy-6-metoxy-1,4-benzoquinol methylase
MDTVEFSDKKASVDYYQHRYAHGYMGHWSEFEKDRIRQLISELHLPEHGTALDFGCGRGIFTAVLKEALPGWTITGCDISSEAIASAREKYPGISFFVLGETQMDFDTSTSSVHRSGQSAGKYDFIHSHHVLEHAFDEKITVQEISSLAAQKCTMLHSMPCNHPGSLEYKLSAWTKNGIDPVSGKFFFEDKAHLRRQSAEQAEALFAPFDFRLVKKYFSNQYWGAIKWIAESDLALATRIANPYNGQTSVDFFHLLSWWIRLCFCWISFFAANAFTVGDRGRYFIFKKILQLIFFVALFPLALPVKFYVNWNAKKEWEEKKHEPNSSEMFLVFRR